MRHANILSGLILGGLALITWWWVIPLGIDQGPEAVMSPRLVPNLTLFFIMGLSAMLVIQNLRAPSDESNKAIVISRAELFSLFKHGVVFGLALAMHALGWSPLDGLMLLLGSLWVLGERRPWLLLLMPTALVLLTWLVFYRLLGSTLG